MYMNVCQLLKHDSRGVLAGPAHAPPHPIVAFAAHGQWTTLCAETHPAAGARSVRHHDKGN